MSLFNQHDRWPIARFNNYKFSILCTSIITLFSILGFLYLDGDNLNISSKVIVAVSQNEANKNIDRIVAILEKNKINYGYKIIPEVEISELLVGLENTTSIRKYLSNKDNYNFPVFIEFNYKLYYKFNIDGIFKDITFNRYIVDNSFGFFKRPKVATTVTNLHKRQVVVIGLPAWSPGRQIMFKK